MNPPFFLFIKLQLQDRTREGGDLLNWRYFRIFDNCIKLFREEKNVRDSKSI